MARKRSWSASLTSLFSSSPAPDSNATKSAPRRDTIASTPGPYTHSPSQESPPPLKTRTSSRATARPLSMLQPYQPPTQQIAENEKPELQPIFNFLNIHSQKLYNEGYFLKLVDLTADGKPGADRSWKECFGQLRGSILSLWDAVELDAAELTGEEVVPTFLNLTDASIKMIEKLSTKSPDVPPLNNVLSISTAGRNRYLFHFNSPHSLAQWTASIRLCMFEQAKLQEIYTGAIIAAKGKDLNGIGQITERTRFQYEDWVRVRFGAGMPWRKCWAVITQPDEKARKKAKAAAKKAKKTAFPQIPVLKGDIKFFETKKTKKQRPIASVVNCYSAYAIYPQSRQLIDHSTLIKMEGTIRIHAEQTIESEGYVFIMPDIHPMVSGFETMLRFLFPTWDTFALYGRPGMLIPDRMDPRSLMFAMPRDNSKDCGYLDVVDVVSLIVQDGSKIKLESEWRGKLKNATEEKIKKIRAGGNVRNARASLPAVGRSGSVLFQGGTFPSALSLPVQNLDLPPQHVPFRTPPGSSHQEKPARPMSDMAGYAGFQPPRTPLSFERDGERENPRKHGDPPATGSSEDSSENGGYFPREVDPATIQLQQTLQPDVQPVPVTPRTTHAPSSRPAQPLPRTPGSTGPSGGYSYNEDNLFAGVVPPRHSVVPDSQASSHPPSDDSFRESWGSHQYETANVMVLRGPPPTRGQRAAANGDHGNHAPSHGAFGNTNGTPGTEHGFDDGHDVRSHPNQSPLPAPPGAALPATISDRRGLEPVRTEFQRKFIPAHLRDHSPADSLDSLQDHLIDEHALGRVAQRSDGGATGILRRPTDEDDFDRREKHRQSQRATEGAGYDRQSESESEYEDDEPDYASINSEPPKVERDVERPRTGRMKVVGQEQERDVVIGDIHYRPKSPGNQLQEVIDMPNVDFGRTINHGRSLSTELNQHQRGSSSHGPQGMAGTSRGSGNSGRPSPDVSDVEQPRRRSVIWQPGMAHAGGEEGVSPERYVSERAAVAQANTRQRYIHHRKTSSGMLNSSSGTPSPNRNPSHEHLPPRPASRGGQSAFSPGGLISTPDLNAPLSAKQQEYVARKTGTSLVQMHPSERAPPVHNTGLLGAIQSKETEKQRMKEEFQRGHITRDAVSPSMQQEIARRQQNNAREAINKSTPSPRPLSHGNFGQSGYFPQQQQQQQQHQQQQYPHVLRSQPPQRSPSAADTGFPHVLRSAPPTKPAPKSSTPDPGYSQTPPPSMQYYSSQQLGYGTGQPSSSKKHQQLQKKRRSGFF